ncbi:MAG: MFS transporter [Prochlorothrix sp.]
MEKPPLKFWQLWNMNFGFLGIQFGWGLQMANMSAIFEYLGAEADQVPILWLAAPMTGLLVQPIIGTLSDNTWGPLGRRRPYFLGGAIFASLALLAMPNVSALWMAAALLWILDSSVNVSMEPFRAFVGDLLPEEQRTQGFALQSVFIGLGSVSAAAMPWLLSHVVGLTAETPAALTATIPAAVKWSFYIGAIVFFGAVAWTVFSTEEYPPEDWEAFQAERTARSHSPLAQAGTIVQDISGAWGSMPRVMKQLAWVQCLSWLGLFCMFLYFPPAMARDLFGAPNQSSPLYDAGIEWAGVCIAFYNVVCLLVAFVLPRLAYRTSRKFTHTLCLLAGAAGLASLALVPSPQWALLSMVGIGMAWSSMLSMPYAILVGALPPNRTGIFMGLFNFFIVVPEVLASLGLGWIVSHWLGGSRLAAVVLGGAFLLAAAIAMQRVQEQPEPIAPSPEPTPSSAPSA